ncbi:hypothetical protein RIF29_14533 [Crotalaria pallida]|uniref:Uncharacterized protein n=1 Tax=Crotalaria pallida TaxID=3830 RepID=A0AAN9FBT9_CROPI
MKIALKTQGKNQRREEPPTTTHRLILATNSELGRTKEGLRFAAILRHLVIADASRQVAEEKRSYSHFESQRRTPIALRSQLLFALRFAEENTIWPS